MQRYITPPCPSWQACAHCLAGLLVTLFVNPMPVHAQLFGSRTVGSPLGSPQTGALGGVAGQGAGILTGSERFLRGNRSRRDFVGSDRNEATGFVGAAQALGVGRVPSATEGLRIETVNAARINRPLPEQPAKGLYYPRLELAFDLKDSRGADVGPSTDISIRTRVEKIAGPNVTVTVTRRIARLQGTVSTQHQADLASRIISFEPGIDEVINQLTVAE